MDGNLEIFTASDARIITNNSTTNDQLFVVLNEIVKESKKGETKLVIYNPLSKFTITSLLKRNFIVQEFGMTSIQKDNIYFIIKW